MNIMRHLGFKSKAEAESRITPEPLPDLRDWEVRVRMTNNKEEGSGLQGNEYLIQLSDDKLAPLFARANNVSNIWLPEGFWKILNYNYK